VEMGGVAPPSRRLSNQLLFQAGNIFGFTKFKLVANQKTPA